MKYRFLAPLTVLLFSLPAIAQEELDMATLNAAIETQRQITETQRQMVITQNMQFTAAESEQFWPLYREYRAEVAKLNDRFIAVIQRFADQYETLDDDEAMKLLKASFKIDSDRIKLAEKFSRRFNRFLPGTKVARFMQIESRLDAVLDLKVKNSIPLAM